MGEEGNEGKRVSFVVMNVNWGEGFDMTKESEYEV